MAGVEAGGNADADLACVCLLTQSKNSECISTQSLSLIIIASEEIWAKRRPDCALFLSKSVVAGRQFELQVGSIQVASG